jgi:site-specific DNA-methyltransferase (adenine-specific)
VILEKDKRTLTTQPNLFAKSLSHTLIEGDCRNVLSSLTQGSVDCIVTSPPYNIGKDYANFYDKLGWPQYNLFLTSCLKVIKSILRSNGSLFLNVGSTNQHPWIAMDVAMLAREIFVLQNEIVWVKNVSIDEQNSFGHYKPINSDRYLNHTNERIFHFTKDGDVNIDRLSIGVNYQYEANIDRWKSGETVHCRGNSWYIPYETIQFKEERGGHPAIFPVKLAMLCIKLHGLKRTKLVLDPFCGTGSSLVAASLLGVESIGIDVSSEYLDIVEERLRKGK